MSKSEIPAGPVAHDTEVDLLVIGSGTGLAAALSAEELGLDVLVAEKANVIGGSTALSGGAYWVPANPALIRDGFKDTVESGREYLGAIVEDSPTDRWNSFLENGPEAIAMVERTTPLEFFWAEGYSDYHPENPGGAAIGRTCESKPLDASVLGEERGRLRATSMAAPIPMPVTGADYKWINLMTRTPLTSFPKIIKRVVQGVGGLAIKREYTAGGQALAAGLFAGTIDAGIPIWTRTMLVELIEEDGEVKGAILEQDGKRVTVKARKGVVLAAGGFDHNMEMRRKYQSETLKKDISLGAETNEGDAIVAAEKVGAGLRLMHEAWWFPSVTPLTEGGAPMVLLSERALPGSIIVDETGKRFVNEATGYMGFGQTVLENRANGREIKDMWLVMDQKYRNRYVFAGSVFPTMPFPKEWYDAGVVVRADNPRELAEKMGVPVQAFTTELREFNQMAEAGIDGDFHRGDSAYDRYYGDPTVKPNPNLRPIEGKLYAVHVSLSDLGTCGGLMADGAARVQREDGEVIPGLYAIGNTAGNTFGHVYPGAGATISQGLVFGHLAAKDAATRK